MLEIILRPVFWVRNALRTTEDDGWGGNFSEIPAVLVARVKMKDA
jgi:hypothetical protein